MKKRSLFHALFTVSGFTFISRIMGLARDILFASYFGAGAAMDAFSVAFRIPNLFRRFFGEGAFNQAFVPVFSEYRQKRTKEELALFLAKISGSLGLVLLLITLLGLLFAPQLVLLFASGFARDEGKFLLTTDLVRLMVPYLFFICMTAMYSSTLNALDRFAIPAMIPVILNIALISGALLSPLFSTPVMALGYAVFIAGVLQLLILFLVVRSAGLIRKPKVAFRSEGVKRVMLLMLPALIGSSSSQINILINTQLASRLVEGSVTWIYYSDRLVEFALGTFAVALGTVVLPRLSRLNAEKDYDNLKNTINWALRLALLIGLPAMIGLVVLAEPLLALLFMRGAFGLEDVVMSGRSLAAYALSVPAFFMIRVLAPVYYARQDTRTPVTYSLIAIGTNIIGQFILVRYYQHAGLALSSAIAAWVNALLLLYGLERRKIHTFRGALEGTGWGLLLSNALLTLLLLKVVGDKAFWLSAPFIHRFGGMIGLIALAITLYFITIRLCGIPLRSLLEPSEVLPDKQY